MRSRCALQGAHRPRALGVRRVQKALVLCGRGEGVAPAACPRLLAHTRAGLPQEGATRRDDAVHGLPLPPRHPRVPLRGDARRRGRTTQQQRGGGAAAGVCVGDSLRDAPGARGRLEQRRRAGPQQQRRHHRHAPAREAGGQGVWRAGACLNPDPNPNPNLNPSPSPSRSPNPNPDPDHWP